MIAAADERWGGRGRSAFWIAACLSLSVVAAAQTPTPAPTPTPPAYAETIQVTATRIPEDVDVVPISIQVIGADELRQRGATDLQSALALVSGVLIAPGGDGGPASVVPQLWGLQEQDAYLLVVDGVPWGGAFNPSVSTLDLKDVERIEVQHGPAPVMYGATSFVGVIQVVRKVPGAKGTPRRERRQLRAAAAGPSRPASPRGWASTRRSRPTSSARASGTTAPRSRRATSCGATSMSQARASSASISMASSCASSPQARRPARARP